MRGIILYQDEECFPAQSLLLARTVVGGLCGLSKLLHLYVTNKKEKKYDLES